MMIRKNYNREIICKNCGSVMVRDDEDYRFEGCTDIYYMCEKCHTSCIDVIRFGKSIRTEWCESEN